MCVSLFRAPKWAMRVISFRALTFVLLTCNHVSLAFRGLTDFKFCLYLSLTKNYYSRLPDAI